MQPERWQQIDQLFHSALELEPNRRAAFLAQECADDESLRIEVESLLASHEQAHDFIETPASDLAAAILAKGQIGLVAGQAVGSYKIVSVLGVGGMGEVYLAKDTRLGRQVALKLLPPQFTINADRLRRFEQEARAVSALNHPNIVTIHEIGRDNSSQFIVTEYIEGQTLRQRMEETTISLRLALEVSIQVTSALESSHAAGIVHRDIKPENIMLRADGYVKVLDFGLAKLTEVPSAASDAEASTRAKVQTESGLVMGTATYMSPEQARGLSVDARTDIFSLGVVLYEMIAARAPFEGATISDVVAAILKEEPAPLSQYSPEVPVELEWMMKKALAKDREERYQTIKELQIDLKRLKQELELHAKLEGLSPSRRRNRSVATKSTGEAIDISTAGIIRASTAESLVTSKRYGRNTAFGPRMIVFAIAAIALFSLISFYVGLKQVPPPSQPTFRQLTFRRGAITGARFSPDGNTLIYSAAFDGKPVELFTSHVESPESSSLKLQANTKSANIQSISSTGEMAILLNCELDAFGCHNGTLARVPLVGGTPREIMEHVYEADWGPDGQELAVVHANDEGQYQLEYPIGTVLYKAPGRIGGIRVSPKGDMVVFIDNPNLGGQSGSVMAVNRKGQTSTLSSEWKTIGGLAWSSTGEELWFSAGKKGVNALYAVTLSGRERLVFQAPGNVALRDISHGGRVLIQRGIPRSRMIVSNAGSRKERDLAWFDFSTSADISADGKDLLFYESGTAVGSVPFVYLRKMDGSNEPVRLGQGKPFALSPDGKWALAVQESSPPQLVLLPTGPGQPRLLPRGDISEYAYASWFPDGEQVLFTGLEPGHGLRSYVQDISGGRAQPITEEGIIALLVSPDGKRLVAWAPDKGPDGKYYLSPIDGTKSTPIPGLEMGEVPIQWSVDGRALYVLGSGDFTTNIYRIDLSSRRRELRTDIVPDPVGFTFLETPGGIRITPDGKSYVYTYWTALRDLFLAEGLK
jgi:serine/threonine protein kinase/Tol biopolymer transport system component